MKSAFRQIEFSSEWYEFHMTRSNKLRKQIITHYLSFSKSIAAKCYAKNFFPSAEFDDYVHYATIGLIEAVDRFNPERNIPFKSYAQHRIKGAIFDGIEHFTESANQLKFKRQLQHDRLKSLKTKHKKSLDFEDIVDITINLSLGLLLEDNFLDEIQLEDQSADPYFQQEAISLRKHILQLLDQLPEIQRLILSYHYLSQMPFKEVSRILSVSPARVAQLHREGIMQLTNLVESSHLLLES